jgi:hypothetical protein
VQRLLDGGASVVAPDLFEQGEFLAGDQRLTQQAVVKNTRESAAYTFCYNETVFASRVHDVLTLVTWIRNDEHKPKRLNVIGVDGAAAIAAAARAIAGGAVNKLAVDTAGFRFADLTSYRDPDFVPGAVKYGDLPSLLALSAPHPLWFGGEQGKVPEITISAYNAAEQQDQVTSSAQQNAADAAVGWLLAN